MRNKFVILLALTVATVVLTLANPAEASRRRRAERNDRWAERFSRTMPWHGEYAHTEWGQPLALVVPPTAQMQVKWGWGVSQSETRPIYHQFERPYPGHETGTGRSFGFTPRWPSHTDQFGVYYIRGPW